MTHRRARNRVPPLRALLTLVQSLALVTLANAHDRPAGDAWALIDTLPRDAALAIVADDLSAHLDTPAGRALRGAIADSGFFRPTFRQWGELAERLDLDPVEAVDALLGRRVVFVSRDLSVPRVGQAQSDNAWALMIWIPEHVEQRVRKRLELAPRTKVAGQPVLAAEHGDFALAMLAAREPGAEAQTILLLAPAADDSMLGPILESLVSRAAERSSPDPAFPDRPKPSPDAFLHIAARTPAHGSLTVAVRPTPTGWEGDLSLVKPAGAPAGVGAHPVSRERFDALAPGALALVMESAPDRFDTNNDAGSAIAALFPDVPSRFLRLMGGRNLLMIERADPAGLQLSLASEITYPGDPVAEGDRAIGTLISPGADAVLPEGAIEGQYPLAARTAALRSDAPSVFGRRATAAWAFSRPAPVLASDRAGARWWALRVAPEHTRPARDIRAFVDSLAAQGDGHDDPTVAIGLVRPHALRHAIADAPWSALPPIEALSRIDRVTWTLTLRPSEPAAGCVLSGRARLDMRLDDALHGAP